MKIPTVVGIVMILTNSANSQYFVTEILNNNVTLTVNPPYIVEGLESRVDIECTFKRESVPSMASVITIIIGHSNSNKTDLPVFNYLASVKEMESYAHNISHDIEVISGSIDNNGESKLHMRFMYPETQIFGLYMCEVTGFDQTGKPITILSTVNVVTSKITDVFSDLEKFKSNVTAMANALQIAESNISFLTDALDKSQSNITLLVNELSDAWSNISVYENLLNKTQSCINSHVETMHRLHTSDYFPPINYDGHEYYFSHLLNNFDYTEMQSKCQVLGGYLAEVDCHGEFLFLRDYVMKLSHADFVFTGATDEGHEGVWINKHSLTARPVFDWAPPEPDMGEVYNCQCFYYGLNWYLADYRCISDTPNSYYICEIPREIDLC